MRRHLIACLLSLAPGLAARAESGEIPASPGTHDLTLQVGDAERTWRLHVPASFQKGKPLPLVVALHGMGGTGAQMERMTGFSGLAEKKGFVVAYPDGLNRIWRYWDVKGGGEDTAFVG
ncbi:MAG: polyhydroxybutyrate depolymerase, partial [Planctomycetes bacterium]|nr:polyhydroxybutyrate depolymerase [Planctomycetota bacterium]